MQASFFEGKSAVVTGAASGIGRALANGLKARGCRVTVADTDEGAARQVATTLGGSAIAVCCDVADRKAVEALADKAAAAFGEADLLFVNAGVGLSGPVIDATPAELEWVFGVNVRGAWNTASVFARRWRDAGRGGAICFTASEHSLGMQHVGQGIYTSSKHAVLGLADVLRAELAPAVQVSALCPGLTATDLHLAKRNSNLPPDPPRLVAFVGAVMERGMPPVEVAEAALRGVAAGEFLIVTHATSRRAADNRAKQVAAAFDEQAPWTEAAAAFEPNAVMDRVRADFKARRSQPTAE